MMKHRPEYDFKIIGENLKRLRVAKSLSVDEVREYLRLGSVQAVYKYEQGKGYPQTDTMLALMELYIEMETRDKQIERMKKYYECIEKGIAS